jgi:LmbE family N-acetylglucosaminyl deacetylase
MSFSLRDYLKGYYQRRLRQRQDVNDPPVWARSAILFSPHQDDETLGCGGTMIKKTAAGAAVTIVYMTDGRSSHGHLMEPAQLSAVRRQEATAAAVKLGVCEADVHFLDWVDGRLQEHQKEAVPQIAELLRRYRPAEVYIPYSAEPPADHRATNQIVRSAMSLAGHTAVVYEYPIWFWYHWPWVSLRQNTAGETRQVIRNTVATGGGRRLLTDFDRLVDVSDVLERKQDALNQHRSQMQPLLPDRRWLTLADVAHGDFLACFFQGYELFRTGDFMRGARHNR